MTAQQATRTAVRRGNGLCWLGGLAVPALLLGLCQAGQEGAGKGEPAKGPPLQRRQSINSLKQIALGMINYADTYRGQMAPSAYIDLKVRQQLGNPQISTEDLANAKFKGKLPLLSWRVAILPFVEESKLYREFKLDEPWDSENNKKLIEKMPALYAPVTGKTKEPGLTYYQVFVGKDAPFNGTIVTRFPASFTDGTANTFLVAEAGAAVPWTKPQDIPYDAGKPLPKLGGLFSDGFHVALADATVRFVPRCGREGHPGGDHPARWRTGRAAGKANQGGLTALQLQPDFDPG
jgi:hypothetical protein